MLSDIASTPLFLWLSAGMEMARAGSFFSGLLNLQRYVVCLNPEPLPVASPGNC